MATKCPTCGRVGVLVNGSQIASINLAAATVLHKQVIPVPRLAANAATVRLKVLTSGKSVRIDGLAVSPT